jgi:hypothetical protein
MTPSDQKQRPLVEQPSALPTRKVGYGAAAGAFATIGVWLISTLTDLEVTPEVAAAITVILTFVTSYFVKNREI